MKHVHLILLVLISIHVSIAVPVVLWFCFQKTFPQVDAPSLGGSQLMNQKQLAPASDCST